MPLTVLNVASPLTPVRPDADGAAARLVAALDAGLARAGHRSLVLAGEGSAVSGGLPPVRCPTRVRAAIGEALARHPVDLVHLHGIDFADWLPPPGVPVLVTLHRPLDRYPAAALTVGRPGTWLHGVSDAQTASAPPGVRLLPPIAYGVSTEQLGIRVPKRRFVAALGRVSAERGSHLAIEAARRAGVQLLLAGRAPRQDYFTAAIQPHLGGRCRFLGPIGFARRRWVLGSARCLLAPNLTPEPGGLTAMESLACGTPVVAFPAGALAEVVEPGITGFLVSDAGEMADAIAAAERLDPAVCRAAARVRFAVEAMVERYLDRYHDLATGRLAAGAA